MHSIPLDDSYKYDASPQPLQTFTNNPFEEPEHEDIANEIEKNLQGTTTEDVYPTDDTNLMSELDAALDEDSPEEFDNLM